MSGNTRRPLRTVAVLGGGITGLLAALALSRALPGAAVAVIDLPPDPAALADRFPTILPAAIDALALTGLDEGALIAARAVSHRLADAFLDWPAGRWLAGFGAVGAPVSSAAFHQSWLQAHRAGDPTPYDRYSLAALMAEAGRFAHPGGDTPPVPFDYALHLDPAPARDLLLRHLAARRVPLVSSTIAEVVRRDDGGVAAIRLADGRVAEADLVLDCTGPRSPLAGPTAEWSAALPCDRLLVARDPLPAPALVAEHRATELGWQARLPLRSSAIHAFGWLSAVAGEGKARRAFGRGADAERVDLRPGRQVSPWAGNVVALGDAAAAPLPLGWPGLTLALADLALLIELLPGRDMDDGERAEYNRRATARADHLRDWQALLLTRSGRTAGPFWADAARRTPPPSLDELLAQFGQRGLLVRHEEDVIDRETWLATLLGLGVVPQRPDPIALSADPARTAAALGELRGRIATAAARMPPYRDYLARLEGGGR